MATRQSEATREGEQGRPPAILLWVIGVFLLILVLVCGWATYGIYSHSSDPVFRSSVRLEVVKTLLQLLAAGISGIVIAGFTNEYNQRRLTHETDRQHNRQVEETKREHLRQDAAVLDRFRYAHLKQLTGTYNNVKKSRRILRASRDPHTYDKQIWLINDAQLELEALIVQIESAAYAYPHPAAKGLRTNIIDMQTYLNALVDEYTEKRLESIDLNSLSSLNDFLARAHGETEFARRFSHSYREAVKSIINHILTQHSGETPV